MKLTIITPGTLPFPPSQGGAVENLIQSFVDKNEISKDFTITIFTVSDNSGLKEIWNFRYSKIITIQTNSLYYKLGRVFRYIINIISGHYFKNQYIYEVLKHKKYFMSADIVLIENIPNAAIFIRKLINKPVVLHLHNDIINKDSRRYQKSLHDINQIICVSEYVKKRVGEVAPQKCKLKTVYNGIQLDRFLTLIDKKRKAELMAMYNIKYNETVILFSGRIRKSKGVHVLIDAFIDLSKTYNVKLLVLGGQSFGEGGNNKNRITQKLNRLPLYLRNNIIFTGFINYSQIHNYYKLADFAVLPSLAPEALSLSAIESLASGLPVIMTDSGGMPEVINDKCGFVLKRDGYLTNSLIRTMEKLIVDQDLLLKMAVSAKKRAIEFSEDNYYLELSESIKETLS